MNDSNDVADISLTNSDELAAAQRARIVSFCEQALERIRAGEVVVIRSVEEILSGLVPVSVCPGELASLDDAELVWHAEVEGEGFAMTPLIEMMYLAGNDKEAQRQARAELLTSEDAWLALPLFGFTRARGATPATLVGLGLAPPLAGGIELGAAGAAVPASLSDFIEQQLGRQARDEFDAQERERLMQGRLGGPRAEPSNHPGKHPRP